MAYNEELDRRIIDLIGNDPDLTTKKMFGGMCYLYNGNMACGLVGDELMVRVGPDQWEALLAEPDVREMDFTGRSLKGFIYVSPEGLETDAQLERWVNAGLSFADTLPRKEATAPKKSKAIKPSKAS